MEDDCKRTLKQLKVQLALTSTSNIISSVNIAPKRGMPPDYKNNNNNNHHHHHHHHQNRNNNNNNNNNKSNMFTYKLN